MNIYRHLPNVLTLCNLLFGVLAIIALTNGLLPTVMLLMACSLVADALDGALARKLGVDGPLGMQLDSLADMVTFGVLPAMMIFYAGANYGAETPGLEVIAVFASLSAVSAGLRLGRFNIDDRPKEYFRGLATPAGAILVASWLWAQHSGYDLGLGVSSIPWFGIVISVFLAIFYQLPLRLPGLKSPKPGLYTGIFLSIIVITAFLFFGAIAIFLGIVAYISLGLLNLLLKWY